MRIYFYTSIITLLSIFSLNIYADEWTDLADDLQQHIGPALITPDVQAQMDKKLAEAYACIDAKGVCLAQDEKTSIRETLGKLEEISEYYAMKDYHNSILGYIAGKTDLLRAMSQEDVPPMGPVVTDILLSTYYQHIYKTYQRLVGREKEAQRRKEESALKYVPEGVIVPEPPQSNTNQGVVVDISDQRLFAFEEGLLVYTTPITSGKRGYGTVQGDFSVTRKQQNRVLNSPFKDQKYRLYVDYWIEFFPKYGIHDACNSKNCWRKEFGGPDYVTRGSHGCVNTPYDAVKWLYEWSKEGTAVRVQQ